RRGVKRTRLSDEGAGEAVRRCSGVRPAHSRVSVGRCHSRKATSVARSSAVRGMSSYRSSPGEAFPSVLATGTLIRQGNTSADVVGGCDVLNRGLVEDVKEVVLSRSSTHIALLSP